MEMTVTAELSGFNKKGDTLLKFVCKCKKEKYIMNQWYSKNKLLMQLFLEFKKNVASTAEYHFHQYKIYSKNINYTFAIWKW